MRILTIADEEDPYLWNLTMSEHPKADLVLSCGDLDPDYLQYLVTIFNCPLLYVHGNHDEHYRERPPLGCTCIEDRVVRVGGIRILGLGGCVRYKDGPHMYTQKEMRFRSFKAWPQIKKNKGFDILLSHAPSFAFGDPEDPAHLGFRAFDRMIGRYRPRYHLYGHVHRSYGSAFVRKQQYECGTTAINACGKHWLDIDIRI